MADEKSTDPGAGRSITTFEEDEREKAAVLRRVIELHPAVLTRDELIRELTGGETKGFTAVDAIDRAISELAGTGLLHRGSGVLRPTRAAVNFAALIDL